MDVRAESEPVGHPWAARRVGPALGADHGRGGGCEGGDGYVEREDPN